VEKRHINNGKPNHCDAEGAAQAVDGRIQDARKLGPHHQTDWHVQVGGADAWE